MHHSVRVWALLRVLFIFLLVRYDTMLKNFSTASHKKSKNSKNDNTRIFDHLLFLSHHQCHWLTHGYGYRICLWWKSFLIQVLRHVVVVGRKIGRSRESNRRFSVRVSAHGKTERCDGRFGRAELLLGYKCNSWTSKLELFRQWTMSYLISRSLRVGSVRKTLSLYLVTHSPAHSSYYAHLRNVQTTGCGILR